MGNTAFDRVSSAAGSGLLREGWRQTSAAAVGAKRQSAGIDGRTINDFAAHADEYLRKLSNELRSNVFDFSRLKPRLLPKPGGKKRIICTPTVCDRIVQRALLEYIHQRPRYQLVNSINYGFIKHRSVKQAARRAKEMRSRAPWAYKTDITAFFDNIDRNHLKILLKKHVQATSLLPLLVKALQCEIAPGSAADNRAIKKMGIREGYGIRQGMPLSPYFSNLFLKPFDIAAERANLEMVRYADDLIVFTDSFEKCNKIDQFCRTELAKIGLTVPEPGPASKTQIYAPDKTAEFLGVGLAATAEGRGYAVVVTRDQLEVIRDKLHALASPDQTRRADVTLSSTLQKLELMINSYKAAYDFCDNKASLANSLANWRTAVLTQLLKATLNVEISGLSRRQLRFLGIT